MSGRISIDNLSDSLKELINQAGLTEEQVINLVKNNLTGDLTQLNTTNKTNIVAAINELFQSANNGKQLIANAIGEPLDASDTFNAMSTDINGLLSTFKTNMMNNGVAVESGDKFKSLIDKIATMVEEGGNKGIQMVNSDITSANSNLPTASSTSYEVGKWVVYNVTFDEPLNFTPTIVLLNCFGNKDEYLKGYNITINSSISFDSTTATTSNVFLDRQYVKIYINNITNTGFTVNLYPHDSTYDTINSSWYSNASYVAIGVGEEDTTLRDSLASILEDEGVSVTEEDDMASLITKVG